MNDSQKTEIRVETELVNRFLTWPVPADVYPDGTPGKPGRTGTNLLTAEQARQMLAHVLGGAGPLTFDAFRAANATRCLRWHPEGIEWSASDWMTAIVGELGELARLIKMRNRERDGLPGNKFSPTDEQIGKEAADVLTYLDLFCAMHGIDLGRAAAMKFNEVSQRVGFPDRIEVDERLHTLIR
jgi:NTP pyrophosphatase (non-canonical NTP hydrolase)